MHPPKPVYVLIVEDEHVSRRALGRLLQNYGYRVATAESAERAMQILRSDVLPEVVLLDVDLPGMHGDEFFAQLREMDVTTILVTAEEPETLQSLIDAGVGLVRKPVNTRELLWALDHAVERTAEGHPRA